MTSPINPEMIRGSLTSQDEVVGPYRYRGHSKDLRQDTQRISVTGTFTATVELIVVDPGADVSDTSKQCIVASFSAPTSQVFMAGGDCDIYFLCSAYTSGTADCAIYY